MDRRGWREKINNPGQERAPIHFSDVSVKRLEGGLRTYSQAAMPSVVCMEEQTSSNNNFKSRQRGRVGWEGEMRGVHLSQQNGKTNRNGKKQRPAKRGPPLRIHPQQVPVVRLSVGGKMRDVHLCWRKCQLLDANCSERHGGRCLCLTVCIGTNYFMRRGGLRWGESEQWGGRVAFFPSPSLSSSFCQALGVERWASLFYCSYCFSWFCNFSSFC